MDINQGQLEEVLAKLPSKGVTSVVPTIASASLDDQIRMLEVLKKGKSRSPQGAKIVGVHLEGPYLAPEKRGAQPLDALRMPSLDELRCLVEVGEGLVRLVTLAPELPGCLEVIEYLAGHGVVVSAGHTIASYDVIESAVKRGLSRTAHLFNGMEALHHRKPGTVGAALTLEPIYTEVILDGIHLDPRIVKLVVRAKGIARVLLVTDSMEATGMGDGTYIRPGNRRVVVKDGEARLESGSLAGSVLTMDRAVQNAVDLVGLSIVEAVRLASYNPAVNLGLNDRGTLEVGKVSDVLILDPDLSIDSVFIHGKLIFQK
jgi:N-acetylglucosamine-6-phosphate deacetylase